MDGLQDHLRRGANDPLELVDVVALAEFAEQRFLFLWGALR